jgi:hypothetical protein
MSRREDDFQVRPGRIRDPHRGTRRPKTFVSEVMRPQRRRAISATRSSPEDWHKRVTVRTRPARRPLAVAVLDLPSRRHKSSRGAPSRHALPLRATSQAHRLPEARGRHPRRRRRPYVRCSIRRCGRARLRRALRGRPASFPVHRLTRGCRLAEGSPDIHPRADGGCRTGSWHAA